MGKYSIKDIEQLSGIKAHTLRIWEQRYQILEPKRTPTNIRYYDDDDLRLVLNISFLNRNSYKISKIAKMSDQEIKEKVRQISECPDYCNGGSRRRAIRENYFYQHAPIWIREYHDEYCVAFLVSNRNFMANG